MMAEYKIPGGKLLTCEMRVVEGVIAEIKLSGDFFMHPEDAIKELEEELTGSRIDAYESKIIEFFQDREIKLFGISPGDFSKVIELALGS